MRKSCFRILGIDPGSRRLGAAVLEVTNGHAAWIDLALVKVTGTNFANRLWGIERSLCELIEGFIPEVIVWEAPFLNHGLRRNPDVMVQLGKVVGLVEHLLPNYAWVEEGWSCEPSSSRKALGSGNGNYFALRDALGVQFPEMAAQLQAGVQPERAHDNQPKAVVACDTVSAMVQAYAVHALTLAGIERRGITRSYRRENEAKPGKGARRCSDGLDKVVG